jgi:hypothetical protein
MGLDLEELLRLYGDDALTARDLDGPQFQHAVFVRMFRKCGLRGTVRNEPRGEVDFVLVEERVDHAGALIGEHRHLFECKNYDRPLELSDAAKLMMIGLRRPVASLNLVSSTELQPQALEYARFFFPFENEYLEERKLGGSTIFRHFVTRDLLGFDPVPLSSTVKHATDRAGHTSAFEIVELRPYSEHIIPIADASPTVSPRYHYRFEAVLAGGSRLQSVHLALLDVSRNINVIETQTTVDRKLKVLKLTTLFCVKRAIERQDVRLQVCTVKDDRWTPRLQIPPLQVDSGDSFEEFRPSEWLRFIQSYGETGAWRVAIVTGEAGTGKTWLSSRLAQELRARSGLDVIQFEILRTAAENCFAK